MGTATDGQQQLHLLYRDHHGWLQGWLRKRLAGLGAGLGTRYARSSFGDYYEGAFSIPSYTVYDASLSYDLGASPLKLKGVKLAMSVQNLTNKTYVAQCTSDLDCYYGEGRTVVSSLTYDW